MGYPTSELKQINYLHGEIEAVYHEAAVKMGISDSVLTILYLVCNNGESCPIHEIIHSTGISKQTLNSALRKLEQAGLVALSAVDRKKKQVMLTNQGKEFVRRTVLAIIEIENDIFRSWSREEVDLYIQLTQRYLSAMKKGVEALKFPKEP